LNPYDRNPIDWTGYGPTGTGGAPTAAEHQQRQRNLHMTAQMARAAALTDPVALAAAERIVRLQHGMSGAGPDQVRRAMFQSTSGQMAMDAAMLMRTTGMIGQGDPITAAANIAQGVAGGGFGMSIGGTGRSGGREYGIGRVGGSGAVAEHVSATFMKKIMSDMYGGTGDTSRMHGFNSQEVSGVFKTLAQRGGIGHVAHLQQNADLQTRLSAAADNAVSPDLRAGLAKLSVNKDLSPEKQAEELQAMADATGDKKLQKEVKAVIKSPDALIGNKDEVRRVGQVVKDITAGLAGLADVYQEMSAPELQQKLESISGMKITNREQAAQASAQVAQLRGAAVISGMDPRAFMDWSSDMQASMRGQVAGVIGADGRHSSLVTGINANIHNQIMGDSAIAYQQSNRAVMLGRSLGVDMADSQTFEEIYEDKKEGRLQYLDKYQGMTMARGGMDNLSGARRKDAEDLLQQFDSEKDPGTRYNLEQQMRSLLASAAGRPGNEAGFDELTSSLTGKRMLAKAYKDPAKARAMEKQAAAERLDAIDTDMLTNYLEGSGVKDADAVSETMLKNLGTGGLGQMLNLSKQTARIGPDGKPSKTDLITGADRASMQRDVLKKAGVTGAAADKFMSQFFDKNGQVKDEKAFGQAVSMLNDANYEPGMSVFEQAESGQNRLEMLGAASSRRRLSAADGGISFNSIATALATGGMKGGVSDPESMVLMLEAMKKEGIKMPQVLDKDGKLVAADSQYETGIDFSNGLTEKGMAQLSKVHGKEIDISKAMGFENMKDLMAATVTDKNLRADAIKLMQTDKKYLGMNLTGDPTLGLDADGRGGMTAITDSAKESGAAELNKIGQRQGAAKMLAQAMGLDDDLQTSLMTSIAKGEAPNLSAFEAVNFKPGGWFSGKKAEFEGGGLHNMMTMTKRVGMATKDEMKALGHLNEGGEMVNKIDAQLKQLQKAEDAGKTTFDLKDDKGKPHDVLIADAKRQLEAAKRKFMNQAVEENGGTTTTQIVVNGNILVTGNVEKSPK
jgi:hypothetical protein